MTISSAPCPSSAEHGTRPNSLQKPRCFFRRCRRQPQIVGGYFGGPLNRSFRRTGAGRSGSLELMNGVDPPKGLKLAMRTELAYEHKGYRNA